MGTIEFIYKVINSVDLIDCIELEFSIVNHSENTIFFSRRNTPFDSYLNDCFIIKENNEKRIQFDGLFVKRFPESKLDIIELKTGKSKSTTFKISESYSFNPSLKYTILFDEQNFRYAFEPDILLKSSTYSKKCLIISNESCFLNLFNKQFISSNFKTIGDLNRRQDKDNFIGITFENASPEKERLLLDLTDKILDIPPIEIDNNNLYKIWFGLNFNQNNKIVQNNFIKIFFEIGKKRIKYIVSNNLIDAYAETTYNGNSIKLYPAFFNNANNFGFDSQLGILIHEFSHITCCTSDVGKTVDDSINLAKNNPKDAIKAANNYEYYIEDLLW